MRYGHWVVCVAGILALLLGAEPRLARAQKKNVSTAPMAEPADYARLQNAKSVTGTIVLFDRNANLLQLRIDDTHYEPNPNYRPQNKNGQSNSQWQQMMRQQAQHQQSLARLQQQMMTARTPQQKQQAMQQMALQSARFQQQYGQSMARMAMQMAQSSARNKNNKGNNNNGPFKAVTVSKVYEFDVKTDAVVRKLFLGVEFDDMGNIKVYSDQEKAALRGSDTSKPGYTARPDDIMTDQQATLHLTPAKKSEVKPGDDTNTGLRPTATMIVLTKDRS